MFQNVSRYVKFLADNKLSQSQFLFLYCIRFGEWETINLYKKYSPEEDGTMIGKLLKDDLIARGFIRKIGDGETATDYEITEKFNHLYLQNHFLAADEIWSRYPQYAKIQGNSIPLLTMDRYKFANMYAERIKYSVDEHLEVVKDVEFGRDNGLLVCGIEKFVTAEMWKALRDMRNGIKRNVVISDLTESF